MIFIKEMPKENNTVDIRVDGILDSESIPILKRVCELHWEGEKTILLHLEGLLHISREGRDFLKKISKKIAVVEQPKFINLEGDDGKD
jgi:hypothetical protein